MLKISRQQALNRWDTLPQNLREALFSEYNSNILWKICESQHLSEDKIFQVAILTGDVIMGFMHPEDLAKEIKEAIGINIEIVNFIVAEINRKIFSLIKNDIDKVYAPVVSETKSPVAEISEEQTIDLRQIMKQREEVQSPKVEVVKIIDEEEKKPIGEVESFDIAQDKPVIIHKEAEVKPVLGIKKSLGGLFNLVGKKEEKPKPIEAQVEIGEEKPPVASKIESPMRVVHYTELRTPLPITNNLQQTTNDKQFTTKLPEQILPPPLLSPQPVVKKTEPIVVKKEEPLVVSKAELKKEEGMIDLSTLRKI